MESKTVFLILIAGSVLFAGLGRLITGFANHDILSSLIGVVGLVLGLLLFYKVLKQPKDSRPTDN